MTLRRDEEPTVGTVTAMPIDETRKRVMGIHTGLAPGAWSGYAFMALHQCEVCRHSLCCCLYCAPLGAGKKHSARYEASLMPWVWGVRELWCIGWGSTTQQAS